MIVVYSRKTGEMRKKVEKGGNRRQKHVYECIYVFGLKQSGANDIEIDSYQVLEELTSVHGSGFQGFGLGPTSGLHYLSSSI